MNSRRPRVLLVDDEKAVLDQMVEALTGRVDTVCAADAKQALQHIWAGHFDLCIADLHMPGMSGLELVKTIREKQPSVGRILMSNYADTDALVAAINEGAIFRFVPKPFSAAQLQSAVDEYVRTSGANRRSELVLVADDSDAVRSVMQTMLQSAGFQVISARDGTEALSLLKEQEVEVAIVDLEMPGMTGFEVVEEARKVAPDMPTIVLSAHVHHQLALDCMASGAFDFMPKPVSKEELLFRVKRALNERRKRVELLSLKAAEGSSNSPLVAESSAMRALMGKVRSLAASEETVLITGETGSGKDALAREIHRLSRRSAERFFAVNCGALSETLLESELFGHERGAFTGALARRRGFFELAHGGTLFLDEVGEMSTSMQVKLLRVLEERELVRVGGGQVVRVDVRVVAATNRNLEAMVESKTFRADLFYRLAVLPLHMTPLRERPEDIRGLLQMALVRSSPQKPMTLSAGALSEALGYPWPGNVRELFNRVARAVALSTGDWIQSLDLPLESLTVVSAKAATAPAPSIDRPLKEYVAETVADAERAYLRALLQTTGGSLTEAALKAGVDRKSIYNKMKAYGLSKEDFKAGDLKA